MCKRTLSFFLVASIACMVTEPHVNASSESGLRKGITFTGIGFLANGLWNIAKLRPNIGLSRVGLGVLLVIGGTCSDILIHAARSAFRKVEQQGQPQPTGLLGRFNAGVDWLIGGGVQDTVQDAWHGNVAPVVGTEVANAQMRNARVDFKNGNFFTGLDHFTDGIYHHLRAGVARMLYSPILQQ